MTDGKQPCIAVVEDDEAVRLSTRMMLEVQGYQVRDFASAEAFLADPLGEAADCLVLDIDLPGMSGFDLLAKLRSQGVMLPAIIVSGNGKDVASRAEQLGVVAVLRKPNAAEALPRQLGLMFRKR